MGNIKTKLEARGPATTKELLAFVERQAVQGRLWAGLAELLSQKQDLERQATGLAGTIAAAEAELGEHRAAIDVAKDERAAILAKAEVDAASIREKAEGVLADAEAKRAEADDIVAAAKAEAERIVETAKAEAKEVYSHIDALKVRVA